MSYTIYKGRLGYYVFANKVVLTYKRGAWNVVPLDNTDPRWRWAAVDLVSDAQEVTDLELLVMTGTSRKDLEERIGNEQR